MNMTTTTRTRRIRQLLLVLLLLCLFLTTSTGQQDDDNNNDGGSPSNGEQADQPAAVDNEDDGSPAEETTDDTAMNNVTVISNETSSLSNDTLDDDGSNSSNSTSVVDVVVGGNATFPDTHWQLTCSYDNDVLYGCGQGDYCSFNTGERNTSKCVPCPAEFDVTKCNQTGWDHPNATEDCLWLCSYRRLGENCSRNMICHPDEAYCDATGNLTAGDDGICTACPKDPHTCLDLVPDRNEDTYSFRDCISCGLRCISVLSIEIVMNGSLVELESIPVDGSPFLNASGPLVNCSHLKSEVLCEEAADGAICMLEDWDEPVYYLEVAHRCQRSGGIGLLIVNNLDQYPTIAYDLSSIPSAAIILNDRNETDLAFLRQALGQTVTFGTLGTHCYKEQTCSKRIPCVNEYEGWFCADGTCQPCPTLPSGEPDPFQCFFEIDDKLDFQLNAESIQSCASVCGSRLEFDECKFCPKDITGFEFGVRRKRDRCHFCPAKDVKYPKRVIRMFGQGVQCWQVQEFFETVEVDKQAQNCQLAQMMNYICGCEGPGYGGANSHAKKVVLAWLPRIMAVLSVLGSGFIIYDASRARDRRRQVFNKLMVVLSIFDAVGGIAYAFTSLPIPATDYIYGARGNANTCITQGFFIQIGTISCYMNVSLAVYYLLVIKKGWSEYRMAKIAHWLVIAPVVVGLAFAGAGVPFYDNMILWCNNSAEVWPEIPVAAAIAFATVIMGVVCWDVYQKEKVSARWRGSMSSRGSNANSRLSKKVFWQSFWYLMAFYLTWPPYLALQYYWASGKAFSEYGLVLAAGTAVPLQGFWNFFVYVRPRYLSKPESSYFSSRFSLRSLQGSNTRTSRYLLAIRRFFMGHEGEPPSEASLVKDSLKTSAITSGTHTTASACVPETEGDRSGSAEAPTTTNGDHVVGDGGESSTVSIPAPESAASPFKGGGKEDTGTTRSVTSNGSPTAVFATAQTDDGTDATATVTTATTGTTTVTAHPTPPASAELRRKALPTVQSIADEKEEEEEEHDA